MDQSSDEWTTRPTNGPVVWKNGPIFWRMDQSSEKIYQSSDEWTNRLTNIHSSDWSVWYVKQKPVHDQGYSSDIWRLVSTQQISPKKPKLFDIFMNVMFQYGLGLSLEQLLCIIYENYCRSHSSHFLLQKFVHNYSYFCTSQKEIFRHFLKTIVEFHRGSIWLEIAKRRFQLF